MQWLKRLLGFGQTRLVTSESPLVLQSPRICFLNLMGPSADEMINEDSKALTPLFSDANQAKDTPSPCDILMIYGDLGTDNHFLGHSDGLRDIIRRAGASIVVIASENEGEACVKAGKQTGYGQANLVMTMKRKGKIFQRFFFRLFEKMFEGKSMMLAWVELAPQVLCDAHDECPETIFLAEISHIIFKRA